MNQGEQVIEYLKHVGSITPMDAFFDLGITKLATRISELKKDGFSFVENWRKDKNRFGKPVKFMVYRLADDEE